VKSDGKSFKKYATILILTANCAGTPKQPDMTLCLYDNRTVDDSSHLSPHFKCVSDTKQNFTLSWESEQADKMICMPHKDFLHFQSYHKQIMSHKSGGKSD